MSTLQEALYRRRLRQLMNIGLVGTIGTAITMVGANVLRHWFGDSPVQTTVAPAMLATWVSYLLHRCWTFKHCESDGSRREVAVFFALNGVGLVIQLVMQVMCQGFTLYALGLDGPVPYNLALLVGTGLGTLFRYWSYRRWVFMPAAT